MVEPVDFAARRFAKANKANEVSALDTLREALRQVEAGEWVIDSITIIGLEVDPDERTQVALMHGGPATTLERIGMMTRSQHMMIDR